MAVRVANGEAIELFEVIELMAACQALYDLATLESRGLVRVKDCLSLWSAMRDQFAELCRVWEDVPPNGELTAAHRAQLRRLLGLCEDRLVMYTITSRERRKHAASRDSEIESFGRRGESTPNGWEDRSTPAHVYAIGRL
jgi:hypothetical protein